jgi:acyl-CoA synthetase (AMP-forming)/AMP-acid ligase II
MSEFSYVCSPRTTPYNYRTVIQVFDELSTSFPDREILINQGIKGTRESLTCQLQKQARLLAAYLVKKGIKKGDRVALSGPNSLEWVIAELGIIMAGGVVVHVPFHTHEARDVYEIALIAESNAFLIDPGKRDQYVDTILQLIALIRRPYLNEDCIGEKSNDLTVVLLRENNHLTAYDDLPGILQLDETDVEFPILYPEDDIAIFTTSGSTGKPKMVPTVHFHASNNDAVSSEKTYNDRPFAWSAGSPIFTIYQGEPRVFSDSSTSIEGNNTMKIWEVIKEEECKSALLSPYFLLDLVAYKQNYTDSFKLDAIVTTGQPINSLYTEVIGIFTRMLKVVYRSTETHYISIHSQS